jgi:hypothetical protein
VTTNVPAEWFNKELHKNEPVDNKQASSVNSWEELVAWVLDNKKIIDGIIEEETWTVNEGSEYLEDKSDWDLSGLFTKSFKMDKDRFSFQGPGELQDAMGMGNWVDLRIRNDDEHNGVIIDEMNNGYVNELGREGFAFSPEALFSTYARHNYVDHLR